MNLKDYKNYIKEMFCGMWNYDIATARNLNVVLSLMAIINDSSVMHVIFLRS
jgi:hypothetical protein